jgi:hypothetical protein
VNHLIVGAGEVGRALAAVLADCGDPVAIRDLDRFDAVADVLHVCIPWTDDFPSIVARYHDEHHADLVVVHSTVPVGTCDANDWVHSPVRGRHPHLVDGLRAFVKHFGGRRASEAAKAFDAAQIDTMLHSRARDTEAGKLWELVQYGVQIRVEKAIHDWCAENAADFDVVYTAMARTYNEGWDRLGFGEFVRPVLTHEPGPIGGHCVRQNASLIDHPLARLVAG